MPIERFQIDNYSKEENNLLEYVFNVANELAPDIVLDENGTPYRVESQAPSIFKRRYNNGKLNVYFRYDRFGYSEFPHTLLLSAHLQILLRILHQ